MEKEEKDIFFVEVKEPDEVRRNVLESLKEVVESLQRFEKFKEMRADKITNINKLGNIVRDINRMVSNLKNSLPQAKIRAMKISKRRIPSKKKIVRVKKKDVVGETKKPVSELEKLEAELSSIENKLQSLS